VVVEVSGGAWGELVRHRDQVPVDVQRGREACHDDGEIIGRHLHRHTRGWRPGAHPPFIEATWHDRLSGCCFVTWSVIVVTLGP
jgi:hypothetical protein